MNLSSVTIALDIMGGDHGPHVILEAAIKALSQYPNVCFHLFGKKSYITPFLTSVDLQYKERISVTYCDEVVLMSDKPTEALRRKKQSSMRLALDSVASGDTDACVSTGNTGALMTIATFVLRCISGISRPALISSLPSNNKQSVQLLDLGASISCDAEALFQYAVMGSVLSEYCHKISSPKVALLNVGEEDNKGNSLIKHANQMLYACDQINYIGYVEGDRIFSGDADVIVTDGFTGNVALKTSEGIGKFVIDEVKKQVAATFMSRTLSKLILPFLKNLYRRMNPDQYNGASLIGLRGIVVKSHGNASSDACFYAIKQAIEEVEQSVPDKIKTKIENVLLEH